MSRKGEKWLFTDWDFGQSGFKIYDSFDSFNLIIKRTITQGKTQYWFNIDNVKREIEDWAKTNNVKIKGLNQTLQSIKSEGFSYTDKGKEVAIKDANERNVKRNVNNPFSHEIKIID